jgi:hypothetical protein
MIARQRMVGPDVQRPPLRGICVVVKDRKVDRSARASAGRFPRRPDATVVSESIPLYFIAQNRNGLWLAREAEGRTGGVFLFKRSALRFAESNSRATGCATMFLAGRFALDVENRGNPLVARLDKVLAGITRFIPDYPPAIPLGRTYRKGEWR